jgi:hypothetical protein
VIARVVPTGTVDFIAITEPGRNTVANSSITASTALRSVEPSSALGVGTQTNTTSRSVRSA